MFFNDLVYALSAKPKRSGDIAKVSFSIRG